MPNDEDEVPTVARDHMQKYANAFKHFHDLPHFAELDTNARIKLWEIWLRRFDSKKPGEGGAKTPVPDENQDSDRPSDRQFGMLRRLIINKFLTEEEVGGFQDLTKKEASDFITKGVAAEKAAKKPPAGQSKLPFAGGATL